MIRRLLPVGGLVVALLLGGCNIGKTINTSSLFAMNTIMELQVAGDEELLRGAEDMIRNLEKELSVTDENSEIARLNVTGEAEIGAQAADIMGRALNLCEETGGALDISIYPVLKAWGFTTSEYRVPGDEEIQELLTKVDYSKVELETGELGEREVVEVSETKDITVDEEAETGESGEAEAVEGETSMRYVARLPQGMQVDLGSVVKGYTATAVADYFREEGVTSALINLGGNVQCIGTKPNGDKWKVAIKSPFSDSSTGMIGVIDAEDVAIITSGGYERYFEDNGEVYWHILDPKTGYPARSGLASVTIIGMDGLRCDGLSTALFVMGLDKAIEFWKADDSFEAVLVTEDGKVYVTEGVAGSFSLTSEYRNAELLVVGRD